MNQHKRKSRISDEKEFFAASSGCDLYLASSTLRSTECRKTSFGSRTGTLFRAYSFLGGEKDSNSGSTTWNNRMGRSHIHQPATAPDGRSFHQGYEFSTQDHGEQTAQSARFNINTALNPPCSLLQFTSLTHLLKHIIP